MPQHTDNFYHSAIKIAYPYSWDIRRPDVMGAVGNVFILETASGTKVCKFNHADIILRNKAVSEILSLNDIPMPQTKVHAYLDTWFESYDYCPGKTLQEYLQKRTITQSQIFDVYKQAINVQKKISQISPTDFKPQSHRHFSDVFETAIHTKIREPLAGVYSWIYKQMSQYGTLYVLHNDVHPGNLIINTNYTLVHLIDMDGVSLCNDDFSILQTLRTYPLDNVSEYIEYYEDIMERKVNTKTVIAFRNIMKSVSKHRRKLDSMFRHTKAL